MGPRRDVMGSLGCGSIPQGVGCRGAPVGCHKISGTYRKFLLEDVMETPGGIQAGL